MTIPQTEIIPSDITDRINKRVEDLKKKTFDRFKMHIPDFDIRYDVFEPEILGMANYQLRVTTSHIHERM